MGALAPGRSKSSFGKTLPQEIVAHRTIQVVDDSSCLARSDEPFIRNQRVRLAIQTHVPIISPWNSSRGLAQHGRLSVAVAPFDFDLISVEYLALVDNRKCTTNVDLRSCSANREVREPLLELELH